MADVVLLSIPTKEFETLIQTCIERTLERYIPSRRQEKQDEELLSREEASQILKISKVTLYKYVKSGLVKAHRINRKVYFKKQELYASIHKINFKNTIQ